MLLTDLVLCYKEVCKYAYVFIQVSLQDKMKIVLLSVWIILQKKNL